MNSFRRVLHYVKRYSFFIVLSMLCAFAYAGIALFIPVIIGQAIDQLGAVSMTETVNPIFKYLVYAGGLVLAAAAFQQLMNMINNKVTYQVVGDIREEAFRKLMKLPLSYLDTHPTGEIVSEIVSDVEQFADGLLLGLSQAFTGIVTIVGTLICMLFINIPVAIAVVVLTPVSLFVARFIATRTYSMFKAQSEARAKQTAFIDEMIGGIKVVKSFAHENDAVEDFDTINEELRGCSLKAVFFSSLTNPCTRFVNSIVYAAVALIGGFMALTGSLSVGMLVTMLSYANQYTKPFNEISGVITELQNALACADRIFNLLDESEELDTTHLKEDAKFFEDGIQIAKISSKEEYALSGMEGITKVGTAKQTEELGQVEFNKVAFAYNQDHPLIEDFNLVVEPGQKVAIVGPTGCGKTTLINLLMRFYDIDNGEIKIDGVDIREMDRQKLREKFGMVLQETWIKKASVYDNIKIGREDATKKEIIAAAKAVHAHSFIKRLPQGYDTILSDNGGLSTGQKQLLCIARVMLANPSMLILDEATSNIDTRTELLISQAFNKLMEGHTSFIVAHRLSTIKNADVILCMKDGHIIEQGNHKELLAKDGFYKQLYMSQYRKS